MKIGLFFNNIEEKEGGGSTFERTVLNQLINEESIHEFYIFYTGQCNLQINTKVHYIKICKSNPREIIKQSDSRKKLKELLVSLRSKFLPAYEQIWPLKDKVDLLSNKIERLESHVMYKSAFGFNLNNSLIDNKIELLLSLTPIVPYVQIPFISICWDLAHKQFPFFPEVSLSGWKIEDRELNYLSSFLRAAYIITGTDAGKQEILEYYSINKDKIKVIPFPVPKIEAIKEDADNKVVNQFVKNNEPYLFYPAQFWPHKNHIVLLEALKILKEEYNVNIKVAFTGSNKGNKLYIEKKCKNLKLSQNVYFLGFVTENDLALLYQNASMMVFPSFFGPDNLPTLEAMSMGCPVLTADIYGVRDQLGEAAAYFKPTDEKELANLIHRLLTNNSLRKELIEKGFKLINKLSEENYVFKLMKVIDDFEPFRRCWTNEELYDHL